MRGNTGSNTRDLSTNIDHSTPRPSDNALGSTLGVVQKVVSSLLVLLSVGLVVRGGL